MLLGKTSILLKKLFGRLTDNLKPYLFMFLLIKSTFPQEMGMLRMLWLAFGRLRDMHRAAQI